jgi:hypothetical protein
MQKNTINNEASVDCGFDKNKVAWHCPTVSRIDIKRTMTGTGTAVDLLNGPTPS